MKELFENWRHYVKEKLLEQTDQVKAAEDKLRTAKKTKEATLAYANNIKLQAAQQEQSAQQELEAAKQSAAAEASSKQMKTGQVAKSGVTSTQPATMTVGGTVEETVGFQGVQDGSMGAAVSTIDENDTCDVYEGITDEGNVCELQAEDLEETKPCGCCEACMQEKSLNEAEYQGRKVSLGQRMKGDVKKYKVYVRNDKGNVVKVNFGDKKMRIKRNNPARRKAFNARHNCSNPGPRWKARYWACRSWN